MKSDATRRAQLETRQAELQAKLTEIGEEIDSHDTVDWEDQATEREDEEVLAGISEASAQELRMIAAAFDRLEAGEYGFCVTCGERIAEERLDILPHMPFCASHAR